MEKVKQSCRADGELIYVQSGWAFFDDYDFDVLLRTIAQDLLGDKEVPLTTSLELTDEGLWSVHLTGRFLPDVDDVYEEFLYAVADIARLQGTGWE